MVNHDPAIEAARRAAKSLNASRVAGAYARVTTDTATAAREALAPIRELHTRGLVDNPYYDNEYECVECMDPWPCATAKLIYTTEELQ